MPAQNPIYGPQMGDGSPDGMETGEEPAEVTEEDQSLIADAIEWAKENPLTAAEYGLTGLFVLATIPVSGTVGALGVVATAAARRFAGKQLGKRAMSLIRRLKPKARATKRIDKRIDLPDTQLTPRQLLERKDLIAKEARAVGREYAGYGGLATIGVGQALRGEDEPQEYGAITLPAGAAGAGGAGGNVDPSTYAAPGSRIGSEAPQEYGALSPDDINPPGFFDNISNAGWMGIINTGLNLAAPQGDSQGFGQDLANAAKAGLGTFTEQTASDRAWTNDELDRDIMREQVLYDISQRGLDRETKRADIAASKAQTASWLARAGERMNPRQAYATAQAHFKEDTNIDPIEVNKLARYYEQYGLEGLDIYQAENAQTSTLAEDPPSGWFWDS
jgi:hypothetical protein